MKMTKRCINTNCPLKGPYGDIWVATFDNYDLGSPIGYGATEKQAIDDLLIEAEVHANG